jgi:probable HAF family extracellular repeat protein
MKRTFVAALSLPLISACADPDQAPFAPRLGSPPVNTALIVYNTTTLPTFGGTSGRAMDINALGQATGNARHTSADLHAFFWQNGAMTEISNGEPLTDAFGMNDLGHVVGETDIPGASSRRAFLWTGGALQDLGTLGGPGSHANEINNAGKVVGYADALVGPTTFVSKAFLWQSGAGMQDLGTLPGDEHSFANDINELGQIVGSSHNVSLAAQAVLWENGTIQSLATLGGSSGASAINELGDIVGSSRYASGELRAVLWSNGAIRDLGTIGTFSSASDINDLGQIVGQSGPTAFLWMDGTMFTIGDGIANAINNDGQVAGRITLANLESRPVIWDVPIRPPVDLVPGDATNTIKLGQRPRNIVVAILSNPYFTAQRVDPASVTLGDELGTDTPAIRDKKGRVAFFIRDLDGDGDTDMVLEFSGKELLSRGDLSPATTKLVLLGRRTDGRAIRAVEAVSVVP